MDLKNYCMASSVHPRQPLRVAAPPRCGTVQNFYIPRAHMTLQVASEPPSQGISDAENTAPSEERFAAAKCVSVGYTSARTVLKN